MTIIPPGSTDQSVFVTVWDDAGDAVTLTAASAGLAIYYRRWLKGVLLSTSAALVITDLATLGAAHSDGGLLHVADGRHRLDLPDAAYADGADEVDVVVSADGVAGFAFASITLQAERASQASVTANGVAIAGVQTTANAIKAKTDLLGTGQAQLTQGGVTTGGTIILTVASTVAGTLTGVGDLSGAAKVWLTIKFRDSDPDSAALVQIEKTAGLMRIAGQAVASPVESTDGSIDVSVADEFTFRLEARAAALLERYRETTKLVYDVKVDDGSDVEPIVTGASELRYPVTRALA